MHNSVFCLTVQRDASDYRMFWTDTQPAGLLWMSIIDALIVTKNSYQESVRLTLLIKPLWNFNVRTVFKG